MRASMKHVCGVCVCVCAYTFVSVCTTAGVVSCHALWRGGAMCTYVPACGHAGGMRCVYGCMQGRHAMMHARFDAGMRVCVDVCVNVCV